MVRVARRFCVDRYEAVLLDEETGLEISAFYPPSRQAAASVERAWSKMRLELGDAEARRMELPLLPGWQKQREFEPRAVSRRSVLPQGYTTGAPAPAAHVRDRDVRERVGGRRDRRHGGQPGRVIDDPEGTFVGGLYARATREGCMGVALTLTPARA